MNTISPALRTTLARPSSSSPPRQLFSSQAQDKFMQHIETINKSTQPNIPFKEDKYDDKFQQILAQYSSKQSFIDSVIGLTEDAGPIGGQTLKMVTPGSVPNLKQSSYEQIGLINEVFQGLQMKENREEFNKLPVIEIYAELLKDIGRKNKAQENKALAKSKAIIKNPTFHDMSIKQIQTDPRQFDSLPRHSSQKIRKKDLILMEILAQKKRKVYATDYFMIMELKLMEFLDFILQNQKEYLSMEPQAKIRSVLSNLQGFQGKMVEGQSMINLLRIFFQEFTSLKREKDQLEANSRPTPMKKLDNKEKTPVRSNKLKDTRKTFTTTPQRKIPAPVAPSYPSYPTNNKAKKQQPRFAWIENTYGHPAKKAMTPGNDEWIGNL